MLRIAVADDERTICDMLSEQIKRSAKALGIETELHTFTAGNHLIDRLRDGDSFHIIFLDIEMEHGSGLEVSAFLRDTLADHAVQIVFITGKTGYERKLFAYQPFYFIAKPFNEQTVFTVLQKYLRIYGRTAEIFRYQQGHQSGWIPVQNILYLESSNRKVILHPVDDKQPIEFYGTLEKIQAQLAGQGFFSPHKSFLVNYRYVALFFANSMELSDGTVIPIAKSRKRDVAQIQLLYENGG